MSTPNWERFKASNTLTISDAISLIEKNTPAILFIVDESNTLLGSLTLGDIIRSKRKGAKDSDSVEKCLCSKPITVPVGTPRKQIIHLFDRKIKAIPEVDNDGKVISVNTMNDFPFPIQKEVIARAKSPVRISFAGGGTDLSYFFNQQSGAVLNTTVQKFAHATLKKRNDKKIIIKSADYNIEEEIENIESINYEGKLALIKAILKLLKPQYGFELLTYSEAPPGSGLGGSAVIASAVIGCFNQFRDDKLTSHEIAELAFQAERIELEIEGGWQDQYATVFGGVNFMEFHEKDTIVHPLRLNSSVLNELESNLILCYSGTSRNSGTIHKEQKKVFEDSGLLKEKMLRSIDIAVEMERALLRGNLNTFASLLDEAWQLKRNYSSKVSSSELDEIYEFAKSNGAKGGKLLGAGGGGYFLFYVDTFHRPQLESALKSKEYIVEPVVFDKKGLRCWTTKALV